MQHALGSIKQTSGSRAPGRSAPGLSPGSSDSILSQSVEILGKSKFRRRGTTHKEEERREEPTKRCVGKNERARKKQPHHRKKKTQKVEVRAGQAEVLAH